MFVGLIYICVPYLKIYILEHIMNQLQTILISVTLSVALTTYIFCGQSLSNLVAWGKEPENVQEQEPGHEQEQEPEQDASSENEIIVSKSFEVTA